MRAQDQSLAAFVAARGPALLRLAWLLTADGPAAEDLVQEALARTIPRWSSIAVGAQEAYLRRAIRSVWIDTWRRKKSRGGLDLIAANSPGGGADADGGEPAADDKALEGTADRLTVAQALGRLTPRQRAVLVLRFYEDQTERETAHALGCSVNTVKSQTRHALERLRRLAPELAEAFGRAGHDEPAGRTPDHLADQPPNGERRRGTPFDPTAAAPRAGAVPTVKEVTS